LIDIYSSNCKFQYIAAAGHQAMKYSAMRNAGRRGSGMGGGEGRRGKGHVFFLAATGVALRANEKGNVFFFADKRVWRSERGVLRGSRQHGLYQGHGMPS